VLDEQSCDFSTSTSQVEDAGIGTDGDSLKHTREYVCYVSEVGVGVFLSMVLVVVLYTLLLVIIVHIKLNILKSRHRK
jgi:hypothetical protein